MITLRSALSRGWKIVLHTALASALIALPLAVAKAQTYEHTSFQQEDANDDWNNDGAPDGTDRFGGTPNDGVLQWPMGTHTTQRSSYAIPEGGRLTIASGSRLQNIDLSLASNGSLTGANLVWIKGGINVNGPGSYVDLRGCSLRKFWTGGGWLPEGSSTVLPAGTLNLRDCVLDTASIEGKWEEISLQNCTISSGDRWEIRLVSGGLLEIQGCTISGHFRAVLGNRVEILGCRFQIDSPYLGWDYYFWETNALTFSQFRSLVIGHTRFVGRGGITVSFEIPDSSLETSVRHCSFVNAPVSVRASNNALQWADFGWNFWGHPDGPFFWRWNPGRNNYDYERDWADHGSNFIVIYTQPDPHYPFPFEPYSSVDDLDEDDYDHDGLLSSDEEGIGTDPRNPDTDGDGIPDGIEVAWHTDPLDPNDPGVVEVEPTDQDSAQFVEGGTEALDAIGERAVDSLRQKVSDPELSPVERQRVVAQAYHDYTGDAIVDQVLDIMSDDLQLVNMLLDDWSAADMDSLVNDLLDGYFTENYSEYDVQLLVNSNLPELAPPPDTLNRLVERRTGRKFDLPLTLQAAATQDNEAVYETTDGSQKAYFLKRDDIVAEPTLVGETEKGMINGLKAVGKLVEKVDRTGFISKIYNADLIFGIAEGGVKNVNRYLTHDGATIRPRRENLVYVKDPPPARLPIVASREVITIKNVGQVSLVYETDDGRKFIKVDGKAFKNDATNWSFWQRSWTSKFVGGIPYQLLPLKCVDPQKGIYQVDDSAIPDEIKNPPLSSTTQPHVAMATLLSDSLDVLFALVDPDSDSVAEVIELDADRDGRFDTFLLSTACDSCGYNVAKVDTNSDGTIDVVFTDLTGDGFPDAVDLNLDGRNDAFDTNGDGYFDRIDYDGDGEFDAYDLNLNGELDLFLLAAGGASNVAGPGASSLPKTFSVAQNYPNPVRGYQATTLRYGLPRSADVRIELYNVLGQKVATVLHKKQDAGWHEISWSPRSAKVSLPSGVYFLRFLADEGRQYHAVRKLVIQH